MGVQLVTYPENPGVKVEGRVQVAAGQQVVISLPGSVEGSSIPLYTFKVGEMSSGAPQWLIWQHDFSNGVSFVNTSQYALSQFDYLYDDRHGYLGFRSHPVPLPADKQDM